MKANLTMKMTCHVKLDYPTNDNIERLLRSHACCDESALANEERECEVGKNDISKELVMSSSTTSVATSLLVRTSQVAVIHVLGLPSRLFDSVRKPQKAGKRCRRFSSVLARCVSYCAHSRASRAPPNDYYANQSYYHQRSKQPVFSRYLC